jgi:hypothetical protein
MNFVCIDSSIYLSLYPVLNGHCGLEETAFLQQDGAPAHYAL